MKAVFRVFLSFVLILVVLFSGSACEYTVGENRGKNMNNFAGEQLEIDSLIDSNTGLISGGCSSDSCSSVTNKEIIFHVNMIKQFSITEEDAYAMAVGCIENDLIQITGCEVKFGYAYVDDKTFVPGLIFTNWELINTEEATIYSAGFVQLKEAGDASIEITEEMVQQGLIACADEDASNISFVIDRFTLLESFSFVYSGKYVKYKQKSNYVVEIGLYENRRSNYDETIQSLYDYDNEKFVWKSLKYKFIQANSYFSDEAKASEVAQKTVKDIIAIQDKNGKYVEVSTLIIYVEENINQYLIDSQIGVVNGYSIDELDKIETALETNQFLVISPDGITVCSIPTVQELSEQRVANGWIKAITGALIIAGSAIVTVATCGAGAPALVTAVAVVSGTVAIGYGACEVIEGVQELYYGYSQDVESKSVNFGVEFFKKFGLSEEEARKTYQAVGVSAALINQLTLPVGRVMSITRTFFQTTLAVGRAVLIESAKMAITGLASLVMNDIVTDVAIKLGMNPAYAKLVGYGSALLNGMLVYNGLNKIDQKFNISGLYPKNPLENIKYTEKVKTQMERKDSSGAPLDNHCFPREVDNYGAYGEKTYIMGSDGNRYIKLRIPGNYKGNEGYFEYIYSANDYTCNHRFFVISR